jgi:hypothetical protein
MRNSPKEKKGGVLPLILLLLFTISFGIKGKAIDRYVLYLKNGTLLYCESYWWHARSHTYEVRLDRDTILNIAEDSVFEEGGIHRHAMPGFELDYKYDSLSKTYIKLPNHYVHEHGFFFQWQAVFGLIDGMRVTMGYRFNRYIALGISMGGEYGVTLGEPGNVFVTEDPNRAPSYIYNSGYSPFLLYLTGDILKTRFTPFYSCEIGYNLPWYPHLQTNSDDGANRGPYSYYTNYGGLTAGIGLGGRVYSRKRSNISISLNMNAGYLSIKTNGFQGFTNTNPQTPIYVTTTSRYTLLQPSVRFSVGF